MRKRYGILLIIVLAILALFTYISKQLYYKNLPTVTAEWSMATSLRYQWDLKGSLHFTEPVVYDLPVATEVVQMMAEPGVWVEAEAPLLQVDEEGLYREWLKAKGEEEALAKQLGSRKAEKIQKAILGSEEEDRSAATEGLKDTEDVKTAEATTEPVNYWEKLAEEPEDYVTYIAEQQYKDVLQRIEALEQLITDRGFVYAKEAGVVLNVTGTGAKAAGAALLTQGSAAGKKEITFGLDDKQVSYCKVNTALKVVVVQPAVGENVSGSSTAEGVQKKEISLAVQRVTYHATSGQYQCVVSTEVPLHMMEGEPVKAQLNASSQSYDTVIPTEAIISNDNGNATFFVLDEKDSILGKEPCVVIESGYILEQNDTFTALSSAVTSKVITAWDKPLSQRCAVKEQ